MTTAFGEAVSRTSSKDSKSKNAIDRLSDLDVINDPSKKLTQDEKDSLWLELKERWASLLLISNKIDDLITELNEVEPVFNVQGLNQSSFGLGNTKMEIQKVINGEYGLATGWLGVPDEKLEISLVSPSREVKTREFTQAEKSKVKVEPVKKVNGEKKVEEKK